MNVVHQSYETRFWHPDEDLEKIVEAAHMCYAADPCKTYEEKENLVRKLIHRGHTSPLEHSSLTVIFTTNRGVTHELVRPRIASYTQESTRYCNYSKDKFGNQITFIWDEEIGEGDIDWWLDRLSFIEGQYFERLEYGYPPQIARGCLTNDVKTKIMVTANYREWRNIFSLRCASDAHPHIRRLMAPLYVECVQTLPCVFEDLEPNLDLTSVVK